MRGATIFLFLALHSISLLAQMPDAPDYSGSVAPDAATGEAALVSRPDATDIRSKHEKAWVIAGFTLDATARGIDAFSTRRALRNEQNQEMFLPGAIVKSQPALTAFSSSIVAAEFVGYRFLTTHHHRKIARWTPYVDAALVLPFAIHNFLLAD